jgi:hypothetical protein
MKQKNKYAKGTITSSLVMKFNQVSVSLNRGVILIQNQ